MGIMKGQIKQLSLQSDKKPTKRFHWGAITIVVIIVAAFVIAPVIPSFFGGSVFIFGSYKGKPIEFYPGSDMEREVATLSQDVPPNVEGFYRQFYYQQVWYTAFMRQAMRMAIGDRVRMSGLLISTEKSNDLVKGFAGFAGSSGAFDLAVYNQHSSEQKTIIRSELEKSALWSRYESDMITAPISPAFFKWISDLAKDRASVSWVKFTKEDFPTSALLEFVADKEDLLCAVSLELVAFTSRSEATKVLTQLQAGEMTFDEIARDQREDFTSALSYEVSNLVKTGDQKALTDSLSKAGAYTPVMALADGRYGFFLVKEALQAPSLSEAVIRDKVILYMQMNQEDLYQETLEGVAAANFRKKEKTTDSVTLNPGGTTLYSPDLGDLAIFRGYDDFYRTIFRLKVGEWSSPFILGDDVYVFELVGRESDITVSSVVVSEALKTEKAQNLQQELLNERDFKNNFYEVYYKSGLVEGL